MKRIIFIALFAGVIAAAIPAFAASPAFSRTLRVGARGSEVSALQSLLRGIPDVYPNGEATGYFGKATEAAVKRFQQKYNLEQVGIVGPKTREKLNAIPAAQPVVVVPVVPLAPVVPAAPVVSAVPVDVSAPLVRLLVAGNIAKDSVIVTWATDEPSDSRVEYGYGGTNVVYDNAPVIDATLQTKHSVRLTGLISGALYHFRVSSRDSAGNVRTSDDATFRTLVNDLSQSTPGICVVADTQKDLRAIGFGDDNIGVGYLKDRRPGAFTLDELRAGCRAEDFIALANNYCDLNPGATIRKYLITYRGPNDIVDVVDFCPTCAVTQCSLGR